MTGQGYRHWWWHPEADTQSGKILLIIWKKIGKKIDYDAICENW